MPVSAVRHEQASPIGSRPEADIRRVVVVPRFLFISPERCSTPRPSARDARSPSRRACGPVPARSDPGLNVIARPTDGTVAQLRWQWKIG